MAGAESERSIEYTPTWVLVIVYLVIVFISACAERGLHKLGKALECRKQKPLFEALERVKEELMLLGFISLVLTAFQAGENERSLFAEGLTQNTQRCSEGNVPLISLGALQELSIFIFVLAVVYVLFCVSTVVLGEMKISQWGHWEQSIRNKASRTHRAHSQIQEFLKRAGNYWRKKFHVMSWMTAFFKQFYGSVTMSDYIALRSGFIQEHCPGYPEYDFHKFVLRTVEHDFKKIMGISWFLWLFVVIFMLMNIAGWHAYFWLSFLPLVLLLIVGAKLEHIITKLAKDVANRSEAAEGTRVMPTDELFWFHRPSLVLYVIHFILFQNAFEIAVLFWFWSTYGSKSCIMEGLHFVIPRLVVGVTVQTICSYSTLPLYALVSQMGDMFKETIFDELTHEMIQAWARERKSSGHGKTSPLVSEADVPVCFDQPQVDDEEITIEVSDASSSSKNQRQPSKASYVQKTQITT